MGSGGESQRWIMLVVTIWIQAFAGTNLDFSSYSTHLKSVLGISQVQLNYIGVASDVGKAFGWCGGIALLHFPTWVLVLAAALMGFVGYGLQWLAILKIVALPYSVILVLSLLAGCSICWLNTVSYVLCIRHFPGNRGLAISLTISYSGVSAALYNLIAGSIDPNDDKLFLLLNAVVPLVILLISLPPMINIPPSESLLPDEAHQDYAAFLFLTVLAIITGLHLLLNAQVSKASSARAALAGATFLLVFPLATLGTPRVWEKARKVVDSNFPPSGHSFRSMDDEDHESIEDSIEIKTTSLKNEDSPKNGMKVNYKTVQLGEEHSTIELICQLDFWLYYMAYFCGATICLVYGNNIGQIAQSLGFSSYTNTLVALFSATSFFGRLLAVVPDFLREKVDFARTQWLAAAIVPAPIAFLLLAVSPSKTALSTATSFIGLSSGFVFSAAVSITSELFGPNRAAVNHNILITNIPVGSVVYSLLAALVYEANINNSNGDVPMHRSTVCIGNVCYHETFVYWWLISSVGLVCSIVLSNRTKATYDQFERQKRISKVILLRSIHSPSR